MALEPSTTLRVYEVLSAIGAGGMGEDRDVALKVLPQAFSDDPDRLGLIVMTLIEMNSGHTQ